MQNPKKGDMVDRDRSGNVSGDRDRSDKHGGKQRSEPGENRGGNRSGNRVESDLDRGEKNRDSSDEKRSDR